MAEGEGVAARRVGGAAVHQAAAAANGVQDLQLVLLQDGERKEHYNATQELQHVPKLKFACKDVLLCRRFH